MSRRVTIRSIMILVAVVALTLGVVEWARGRPARLAAAQAAREGAMDAKLDALAEQHRKDQASWFARFVAYQEADQKAFTALEHWKNRKLADSAAIERLDPAEFTRWPHPDPSDTFPIIRGPSGEWDKRLEAHKELTNQCRLRANYHQQQRGLCWVAAQSSGDVRPFEEMRSRPPPAVDPYPPKYRGELAGEPPRKPAVEPFPTTQGGLRSIDQ